MPSLSVSGQPWNCARPGTVTHLSSGSITPSPSTSFTGQPCASTRPLWPWHVSSGVLHPVVVVIQLGALLGGVLAARHAPGRNAPVGHAQQRPERGGAGRRAHGHARQSISLEVRAHRQPRARQRLQRAARAREGHRADEVQLTANALARAGHHAAQAQLAAHLVLDVELVREHGLGAHHHACVQAGAQPAEPPAHHQPRDDAQRAILRQRRGAAHRQAHLCPQREIHGLLILLGQQARARRPGRACRAPARWWAAPG